MVGWWVHLHVVPRHTLLKPGAVLRRGRVTPYLPPEAPAILLEILKSMHVVCSEEAWLERWGRGLGLVTHTGSIALRPIEKPVRVLFVDPLNPAINFTLASWALWDESDQNKF